MVVSSQVRSSTYEREDALTFSLSTRSISRVLLGSERPGEEGEAVEKVGTVAKKKSDKIFVGI